MLSVTSTILLSLPLFANAAPSRRSTLAKRDYPTVGACSGDCSAVHDPNVVISSSGTYYRFITFNEITIATAPSITGPWTSQGAALPGGSSINLPGNKDLWAPDVSNIGGTYYMYYAVSTGGSQNSDIGVATSTTMDSGSWTDHGSIGISPDSAYNKIDPNLLQVQGGASLRLSFGSYWDDIYQIAMANPPLTIAPGANPVHLEQNTTARPNNLPTGPEEGSFQFWWPVNGQTYYYLFFSAGDCCDMPPNLPPPGEEYKVMVCRSESPMGRFVDQNGVDCLTGNGGTIVLESHDNVYAPGGEGVIYDPGQNSVVMYYHYGESFLCCVGVSVYEGLVLTGDAVNPSIGYDQNSFQFGWNKLDFSSGWPVVTS
ncbi:MAG: hypothetical protein LQ340_004012 [Diploschistes diacapsis]|nr:MAG: hypothetical protein LQ340_004012 [Diploschistes diacapsis]